jgi:hypothetical protein
MKTSKWLGVSLTVAACLHLLGCGGVAESQGTTTNRGGAGGAGTGGSSTGGSSTGGSTTGGGGGGSGSGGNAPDSGGGSNMPVMINSVAGRVIDDNGAALRDALVSVCGEVCYSATTDDSGRYTVEMGVKVLPEAYGIIPHVDFPLARFFAPLPAGASGNVQAPDLRVLRLPDGPTLIVKTDNPDAPKQSVVSGDVTLSVDAGIQALLSIEDVVLDTEGKKFRAMKVPTNLMANYAKPEMGLRGLYAVGPFHVEFKRIASGPGSARAYLTIKNTLGLSANQTVDFLSMDVSYTQASSKPGTFYSIGKGKVSSDGTAIEMNSDQSLKYLDWIGIR